MANYETHSFSVALATEIGLEETIVLQHFHYWHKANKGNEMMIRDGYVWCYSSRKSILEYFPYLSERRLRTTIDNLVEKGLIVKANMGENKFNKTNWYALTDEALAYFNEKSSDGLAILTNGLAIMTNQEDYINNNIQKETRKKKIRYAEAVTLTEEQHDTLVRRWGENGFQRIVTILDEYKRMSGKKYKEDYLAIGKWVERRYVEEGGLKCVKSNASVTSVNDML